MQKTVIITIIIIVISVLGIRVATPVAEADDNSQKSIARPHYSEHISQCVQDQFDTANQAHGYIVWEHYHDTPETVFEHEINRYVHDVIAWCEQTTTPVETDGYLTQHEQEVITESMAFILCPGVAKGSGIVIRKEGYSHPIILTAQHVYAYSGGISKTATCYAYVYEKDAGSVKFTTNGQYLGGGADLGYFTIDNQGKHSSGRTAYASSYQSYLKTCRARANTKVTTFGFPHGIYRINTTVIDEVNRYTSIRHFDGMTKTYRTRDDVLGPGSSGGIAVARDEDGNPCLVGTTIASDGTSAAILDLSYYGW